MKDIPNKIFLNIDTDGEPLPGSFKELQGVSWCDERINKQDIEYIRKVDVIQGEEKMNEYLKMNGIKIENGKSDFILAWRLCYEWMTKQS